MTKTALNAQIARKRREVVRLQEDLGDMLDHLAVIEARAKFAGEKCYSTAEVKSARPLSQRTPGSPKKGEFMDVKKEGKPFEGVAKGPDKRRK